MYQHAAVVTWHVPKVTVRTDWLARTSILHGPKQAFLPRNGTNDHDQPRSVPLGPTRSNRVQIRPDFGDVIDAHTCFFVSNLVILWL